MSKQKRGIFRRMIAMVAMTMGFAITHHYADPVFRDSRGIPQRRKKRAHNHISRGRFRRTRALVLKAPPCIPGTISYHDKLVRHFGRRRADAYGRVIRHRNDFGNLDQLHLLPTEQDFRDTPEWGFLDGR